jgi:hypothetical protein
LRRCHQVSHAILGRNARPPVIDQIAIFELRNRSRLTFRLWRYSARSGDKSLIYDG